MNAWTVVKVTDRHYSLLTGPGEWTDVIVDRRSDTNIFLLMKKMEIASVPISFARFLRKIHVTSIPADLTGMYNDDVIKLSMRRSIERHLDTVLVHEIAHHVIDYGQNVLDKTLRDEFKNSSKLMPDRYAREDVHEYFAVGFEVYYFGSAKVRDAMSGQNPVLFSTINSLHDSHLNSGI